MSKNEKSFQNYFMKIAKPLNYYRTSLATGSGYPDVTGFHKGRHSLVELKDLELGKRGNKKLRQCFELSQPPWYMTYLRQGGTRLFVAFRIRDAEDRKWYGLLRMTTCTVRMLAANEYSYRDMRESPNYKEFTSCKDMINNVSKIN